MRMHLPKIARMTGLISASLTTSLMVLYVIVLALGLMSLTAPDQPIGNPYFTIMELLIILLIPPIILMMVAIVAVSSPEKKVLAIGALTFMAMTGVTTSSVHFAILTLKPHASFAGMAQFLEFQWPSIVYALDILAWDFFFAVSVLLAANVFEGGRLAVRIRNLLLISGTLALIGLAGVPTGNMQIRNIGIFGYAVVFAIASGFVALFFYRTTTEA